MKMTKDEKIILQKVCLDEEINPKILLNIFESTSNYYFQNDSRRDALIIEILREIKYWSEVGD